MNDRLDDDLTYRSIEWTHGIVREWLTVADTARAMQRNMPPLVQEHLASLPSGFAGLAGAVALTINPESLIVAQAVLSSSDRQFESLLATGSLSHPLGTLADKTDAEMGAVAVDGDEQLRERLGQLEAENRELRTVLSMIGTMSDTALASPVDRAEQHVLDATR